VTSVTVIPLVPSQIKPGAALMARAFFDDPFFTCVLPDAARRARVLPRLFEKTMGYGQRYGSLFTTAALEGIAMWLGPQHPTLSLLGTLRTGLFLLPLNLRLPELRRSLSLARYADRLHETSIAGNHWYLVSLGVEPSRQGQGVGQALLQPVLAQADREGKACYLDTHNEQNIPFYEHNGFAVQCHGQAGQATPPVWGMLRQPQK
jgi:GNAT superfamily N-acetyltransferase